MEIAGVVANQVIIMFLLIITGYVITKFKMFTKGGSKELSNLLMMVVTPCVLIKSYSKDFEPELAIGLLKCLVFSLAIHIVAIILANIIIKKKQDYRYRIERFLVVYSNCGFMAIPLLQAALGADGVFFGSAYLVVFTILSWSHGLFQFTGDKNSLSAVKIITTPGIVGVVIGMILFLTGWRLPGVLFSAVDYMSALNTPVAMVLLGVFLSDVNFKKAILNKKLYLISVLRLLFIPVISILIGRIFGLEDSIMTAVIITAACPCATASALFAAKYDMDAAYASEIVSINTLFSIFTIPLIMVLLNFIKF